METGKEEGQVTVDFSNPFQASGVCSIVLLIASENCTRAIANVALAVIATHTSFGVIRLFL